jgi:GntR family transcriptional regulator / MocR family aminotransferase
MPRQTAQFALMLPPREPGMPATRWLHASLRSGILQGRLRAGARLPATRDLAKHYGLSRGTIVTAFDQLRSEGYLEARVGSGTFVAGVLPDHLLQAPQRPALHSPSARHQPRRLSDYARRVGLFPNFRGGPVRAFRTDQPALELFPTTLWAQVAGRRLRKASTDHLLACGPMGYPPLQQAVAEYLTTSRGVQCTAEQVAIVSGLQEALDLVARLFLNPGDRVAMENPGYPGAALTFAAVGATIAPVHVDEQGMSLAGSALEGARLVYVTPAHQFPLGVSMSLSRRLALLEWARLSAAIIFEDDYDGEYRYSGRPLPALQGMDRYGQVIFAGTFSKVLFPSVRLGYLVVPTDLVDRFTAALSLTSRHAPVLEQAVLADFIGAGHFGRHIRRMREVYAERLSLLLECARQELAGLLEISSIEAGLQTVGWLRCGIDGASAARAAAARDVEITPLNRYARGSAYNGGLHLGFSAVDSREIRRGVRELAIALEQESAGRRGRRG